MLRPRGVVRAHEAELFLRGETAGTLLLHSLFIYIGNFQRPGATDHHNRCLGTPGRPAASQSPSRQLGLKLSYIEARPHEHSSAQTYALPVVVSISPPICAHEIPRHACVTSSADLTAPKSE